MRYGVLNWKTGCLVSRCSGEPVFPAPSPLLSPLHSVCCVYISSLFLSLSFPLNFLSWDGGWGLKLFQELTDTGKKILQSTLCVMLWIFTAHSYGSVLAGSTGMFDLFLSCSPCAPFVPVSAVHDFRRSSHPHAHARHLGFAHARA